MAVKNKPDFLRKFQDQELIDRLWDLRHELYLVADQLERRLKKDKVED